MSTQNITKETILTFLREQHDYLRKNFGVERIALFGSYARGQQHPSSDIDLLVQLSEVDFEKRMLLKKYLEDHFNKTIDLGYFSAVRPFIMRFIKEDLIYA